MNASTLSPATLPAHPADSDLLHLVQTLGLQAKMAFTVMKLALVAIKNRAFLEWKVLPALVPKKCRSAGNGQQNGNCKA